MKCEDQINQIPNKFVVTIGGSDWVIFTVNRPRMGRVVCETGSVYNVITKPGEYQAFSRADNSAIRFISYNLEPVLIRRSLEVKLILNEIIEPESQKETQKPVSDHLGVLT